MAATNVLLILAALVSSGRVQEGRFDLSCVKSAPAVAEPHSQPLHFSIDTTTGSYCDSKDCKSDNALAEVSATRIVIYSRSGMGGLDNVYRYGEQAVLDRVTNVLTVSAELGGIGSDKVNYDCDYEPYSGPPITSMH